MVEVIIREKNSEIFPYNLKCEYCIKPIGIDTPQPRFSWELQSDKRNITQIAYRIIVATTMENAECGIGDMWDSGMILSDEQIGIHYKGKKLLPVTRYWWKVMVWDGNQSPSGWSEIETFVTGFFSMHDWCADWFHTPYRASYARKEFVVDASKAVTDAIVFVAALGDRANSFQLRLNGSKVGDDIICPGPTEDFRALYRSYDVKHMLLQGQNALGLVYVKKVSVILVIHYSDGSVSMVVSDQTWKCADQGPIVYVGYDMDFRRGRAEEYNALMEFENWDLPGFDDQSWTPVRMDGFRSVPLFIKAQMVGCSIHETRNALSVTSLADSTYIVDFGQNMSGFARFSAEGPPGTEITVNYAENLLPDGTLDTSSYAADESSKYYTRYILKGKKTEFYQPTFMYTSFRYVQISGYPGQLTAEKIEACFVHSDVLNNSSFDCSNDVLNRLQACASRSFLSNLVNIPTDCPGRERRGWTADAFSVSEAECIQFNMFKFYEKWFDDMSDCQRGFGWIPVELPQATVTFIDVIWPAASIFIPWDIYNAYGDKDFIKKYLRVMEGYVNFLCSICDEEYMFINGHISAGDWLARDPATNTFMAVIYFYRCVFLLSKMAKEIGDRERAEKYEQLSLNIKNKINDRFLKISSEKCFYDNNSQSANAHAIFFNIVPPAYKQQILESLVQKIREDGTNTTGFLGTMCLLPVLAENGRNELAYSLITNTREGGWLYIIENNKLTTMAEDYYLAAFKEKTGLTVSFNHAFLCGSLSSWFYKQLAGISPLKPGYKEICIKPFIPPDVEYVRAQIDTMRGKVSVEWKIENNSTVEIRVCIPPNTCAKVYLSILQPDLVTENGIPALHSPDVSFTGTESGYSLFKIGSGEYVFRLPFNVDSPQAGVL